MIIKNIPELNPSDLQRFWNNVKKTDNCWVWIAGKNSYGYGQISVNGKMYSTHRVSYTLFNGKIPDGLELDHLCQNKSCVNPEHLEAVTHHENMKRCDLYTNNHQRIKTHCPKGHEYTKGNTYFRKKTNYRKCRICNRINESYRYHKKSICANEKTVDPKCTNKRCIND